MSDLLKKVAKLLGVPENLIQRSSEARAEASGKSTDEVLQSWAGGEAVVEEEVTEEPVVEEEVTEEPAKEEPVVEEEVTEEPVVEEEVTEEPKKKTIQSKAKETIVLANKTLGIQQKESVAIPRWINLALIIIPSMLLIGLVTASNVQECGENGILAIDRKSQTAVNCDGSKFEGKLVSANKVNYIAIGQEVYSGSAACAGCHGANGGGGVGPAFIGGELYTTFPTCSDHVKWVQLGSSGWQSEIGAEYGAENKISIGGMPGFQGKLTDEEIRAVVAFERIVFGGEATESVLIDCGLQEANTDEETNEASSLIP